MAFPAGRLHPGRHSGGGPRGPRRWAAVANAVADSSRSPWSWTRRRCRARDLSPPTSSWSTRRWTTPGCATSAPPSSSATTAGSARSTGSSTAGARQAWATWDKDSPDAGGRRGRAGAEHLGSPLVNEGGGIHVDGEGTVLVTETVQLDPGRNPDARPRPTSKPSWRRTLGADARRLAAARADPRLRASSAPAATSTSWPPPVPGRRAVHWQRDPAHPDYEVIGDLVAAARRDPRTPQAGRWRSSSCPPRRPCATRRARSTTATSTTWWSTAASSPAASATRADADAPPDPRRRLPRPRVVDVDARPIFARGGGIHCITQQQPSASRK